MQLPAKGINACGQRRGIMLLLLWLVFPRISNVLFVGSPCLSQDSCAFKNKFLIYLSWLFGWILMAIHWFGWFRFDTMIRKNVSEILFWMRDLLQYRYDNVISVQILLPRSLTYLEMLAVVNFVHKNMSKQHYDVIVVNPNASGKMLHELRRFAPIIWKSENMRSL